MTYLIQFFSRYARRQVLTIKNLPKADLYYLHFYDQLPAVLWMARRHGAKIIYDAHDFYSALHGDDPLHRFYSWQEKRCIDLASATVTVGDGIVDLMGEKFSVSPTVLRNGHDQRLDTRPVETLRERLGLSRQLFLIVLIGMNKAGQAVEEVLQAMTQLPEQVVIAFLGRYYEPHVSSVEKLGLGGRVHFLEPVKPMEVVPFVRSADAALITYYPLNANLQNVLPNKFFQAIAAGLPLLYPPLKEMQQLADAYDIGRCIDPTSPTSIRQGIRHLLNNPDDVRTYRRNLEKAHQELSWQREEAALGRLVESIL